MTVVTAAPPRSRTLGSGLRVTQLRVITSEWIKLRSLRSTVVTMAAAAVVLIGLGLLFSAVQSGQIAAPDRGPRGQGGEDPTAISLSGVLLAQLIIGTLGVMVSASEYTTGMIRSSLVAVPRRLPVLWAKSLVLATVTFVLMTIAAFAAFAIGQAVLSAGGAATASLSDPGVLRAVIGAAVELTAVGLLGLALGALLRNTAGAVSTLFGVTFLLPGLAQLLPSGWRDDVTRYLPSNAIEAFRAVQVAPGSSALSPWAGLGVFAIYLVIVYAAAAVLLIRRDA